MGNLFEFFVLEKSCISLAEILLWARWKSLNTSFLLPERGFIPHNGVFGRPIVVIFQGWKLCLLQLVHSGSQWCFSEEVIFLKIYHSGPLLVFDACAAIAFYNVGVSTGAIRRVVDWGATPDHAAKWTLRVDLYWWVVVLSWRQTFEHGCWLQSSIIHHNVGVTTRAISLDGRELWVVGPP